MKTMAAIFIVIWIGIFAVAANAWRDDIVTCESPKGEIRQFPNYTCPAGWWEV